ncbi:MAG: hypothetical protein ACPHYE_07605 [Henriciella sp.]
MNDVKPIGNERFISTEEVDRALQFIRDNALALAEAKGAQVSAQHLLKHVLAVEMCKHDGPISKADMLAKASQAYVDAIDREMNATIEYEKLRGLINAADKKIEVWRTQESNVRAGKL